MMDLNEDDFLERLMPYFRSGDTKADDPCPNPDTLSAFVEGTLESGNRGAVQIHVARCSSCAQLCVRLKDFVAGSVTVGEAEWRNAEKRLDNWMEGFLRTTPSESTRPQQAQRESSWLERRNWLPIPTRGYALAGSLSIALVIGITIFGVRRRETPQVASVGHQTAAGNPESTQAVSVPPETHTEVRKRSSAPMGNNPTTPIPSTTLAHSTMPRNGRLPNDIVPLKGEHLQAPLAPAPTQASRPDRSSSILSEIQIQAGTEILLRVDSVTSQPDGRFVFRAYLSQPVVQDGKTVLPSNVAVVGSGTLSGDQTSLLVSEIDFAIMPSGALNQPQSRRYALKHEGAQANLRFSSRLGGRLSPGQTLEARFVMSSNYFHEAPPNPRVWEVPNPR
jgi:hypothetical protein